MHTVKKYSITRIGQSLSYSSWLCVQIFIPILMLGVVHNSNGKITYKAEHSSKQPLVEQTSENYFEVIGGSGKLTAIDLLPFASEVIEEGVESGDLGIEESEVTGNYDPTQSLLSLDIACREVELLLSEPIEDGKSIEFTIESIAFRNSGMSCVSPSEPPILDAVVKMVEGSGLIIKNGDQIRGEFVVWGSLSRGSYRIQGSNTSLLPDPSPMPEGPGQIHGEFSLLVH